MIKLLPTLLILFLAFPVSASDENLVAANNANDSGLLPYHQLKIDEDFVKEKDCLAKLGRTAKKCLYTLKLSDQVHGFFTACQVLSRVGHSISCVTGKFVLVNPNHLSNIRMDYISLPDTYIAFVNFTITPAYNEEPSIAHLDYIETNKDHRHKGYATSMVQAFIEIMKNSQIDYLTTSTRTQYSEKTFNKCGFRPSEKPNPIYFSHDTNHFLKLNP